jgi:hypothetical protein
VYRDRLPVLRRLQNRSLAGLLTYSCFLSPSRSLCAKALIVARLVLLSFREGGFFRRTFDELPAYAEAMADKNSGIISEPNWKLQQRELLPNFRGPLFGF